MPNSGIKGLTSLSQMAFVAFCKYLFTNFGQKSVHLAQQANHCQHIADGFGLICTTTAGATTVPLRES